MVAAVQMYAGETFKFTRGHATLSTVTVLLKVGTALVINRGFNDTIFVKSGARRVSSTRIMNLKEGQTVFVKAIR